MMPLLAPAKLIRMRFFRGLSSVAGGQLMTVELLVGCTFRVNAVTLLWA